MQRYLRAILGLTLLAFLPVLAVACGDDDDDESPTPTEPASQTQTPAETETPAVTETPAPSETAEPSSTAPAEVTEFNVYFMRGEFVAAVHREVPATEAVGAAAMEQLLSGPTSEEAEPGLTTSIPEDTAFLGLEIEDGVATVDLSSEYESGGGTASMRSRLGQVVYTLTQFPTISGVLFELEGEPVDTFGGEGIIIDDPLTRDDFEDVTPAIFVDEPAQGETVSSPMRITGTANTFEAVFHLNIVDAEGLIIAEERVMATSGTGTRGTFDVTVPFDPERAGLGALIVFERSPQDGSQINIVEIPLTLEE